MYDGDPPTLVSLYGRKLRMVIRLRTFTTLGAWHCVNRRTKATAVASTKLRPGIGAWPVAVTHSLATCHATFRPIGIRGVSAMNWNEWTKQCEGKKGTAESFVFFLSSECLRLYITEFFLLTWTTLHVARSALQNLTIVDFDHAQSDSSTAWFVALSESRC